MTREQKENAIYKATHKDFKGVIDGKKSVLRFINGATRMIFLCDLSDQEIDTMMTSLKIKE